MFGFVKKLFSKSHDTQCGAKNCKQKGVVMCEKLDNGKVMLMCDKHSNVYNNFKMGDARSRMGQWQRRDQK